MEVLEFCDDPALALINNVIESPIGPMLVYKWAEGELVSHSIDRINALPVEEVVSLLNAVYSLHEHLADVGWVAVDFYHGSMIYDFERKVVKVIDVDHYRYGPSTNERGRMFGSKRFMSPEEFELGAPIDQQSNVFTMGRTAAVLLSDGSLDREPFRGNDAQYEVMLHACQDERAKRYETMAAFWESWQTASAD